MSSKPFIISVDDDPNVLKVVDLDLRTRYGKQFRVFALNSGNSALEFLKNLNAKNDVVALFVIDQRMPQMTGVEFLAQARLFFPAAKRVLLTAYADTEAAIQAINEVDIPVMAAYLCFIALVFVLINLVVDLTYYAVDPRLRAERAAAH